MSTLVENVAKVTNAHAALKTAIAAKGVAVPDGTKLTDMPALVEQISTEPVPTNQKAAFTNDTEARIIVPKTMVVDMLAIVDLSYCFFRCDYVTSFDFPAGFGQNATSLEFCFSACKNLTSLTLPAGFGQNAETIGACFSNCNSLISLTLGAGFGQNTKRTNSKRTNSFIGCFQNCSKLTSLHLPTGFGQNSTSNNNCFQACGELADVTGNPNFKASFVLSKCTKLTHDSLMVFINGLQTVTTTQKLTLGSNLLYKLTDDEKKVATDKGWTLD